MKKLIITAILLFTNSIYAEDIDVNSIEYKYFDCVPERDKSLQKCGLSTKPKSRIDHTIKTNDNGEVRIISSQGKLKVYGTAPDNFSERLIGEIDLDFLRNRIKDHEELMLEDNQVSTITKLASGYGGILAKVGSGSALLASSVGSSGTKLTKLVKVGTSSAAFFASSAFFTPADMEAGDSILKTIIYTSRTNTPELDPDLTKAKILLCNKTKDCYQHELRQYSFDGTEKYKPLKKVDTNYQDLVDIFKVSLNESLLSAIPYRIIADFKGAGRFLSSQAKRSSELVVATGRELTQKINESLQSENSSTDASAKAQIID